MSAEKSACICDDGFGINLSCPIHHPADLEQLQAEIRGIQPQEHPICPGCGEKHAPGSNHLAAINVIDMAKGAGSMLDSVPVEHIYPMIASFIGSFAESISEATWTRILAHKMEPCGEEGCDCHSVMQAFIPELHKLKVKGEEGKAKGWHADPTEETK